MVTLSSTETREGVRRRTPLCTACLPVGGADWMLAGGRTWRPPCMYLSLCFFSSIPARCLGVPPPRPSRDDLDDGRSATARARLCVRGCATLVDSSCSHAGAPLPPAAGQGRTIPVVSAALSPLLDFFSRPGEPLAGRIPAMTPPGMRSPAGAPQRHAARGGHTALHHLGVEALNTSQGPARGAGYPSYSYFTLPPLVLFYIIRVDARSRPDKDPAGEPSC